MTAKTQDTKGTPAPFVPVIKKILTLPLVKPQIGVPVYIKVTSAMFTGKDIGQIIAGKKADPATLVNCVDLESGQLAQIITPAVLAGIFTDEYSDDSYVGCCFAITKLKKSGDKNYHPFTVMEIEAPE